MLLSIAMMVKNEEKHLESCLESLQPILNNIDSELIIVDTGSTDNTIEIAKRFTEKLYFHQWNNNFSDMRNITISYAKGKWIFILDGDEVLENCNNIIKFFNSGNHKNYKTAIVPVKNFTSTNYKKEYYIVESLRLFENSKNFKYKGAVHNQPVFEYPIVKIDDIIQHYGYVNDDKELMEKKFNRTVTLLKKELKKDPQSIYYNYQLAGSYSMHKDNKEALHAIKKAYELCKVSDDKARLKGVFMLYCLIQFNSNNLKEIEELGEEALALFLEDQPYKIDIYYFTYKAKLLLNKKKEALENFKHYLRLIDKNEKGLLPVDLSISTCTTAYKDKEFPTLLSILFEEEEYKEIIEIFSKQDSNKFIKYLQPIINAYLKLKDYVGLKDYYYKLIREKLIEEIKFSDILEELKGELSEDIEEEINKLFSIGNGNYEKLNYIRTFYKGDILQEGIEEFLKSVDFENVSDYYGDVIYHLMRTNYDVTQYINKVTYSKLHNMIQYCIRRHKDFSKVVNNYLLNKNIDIYKFEEVKATVILYRYIILLHEQEKEQENEFFKNYVEIGKAYIKFIYSDFVLDKERLMEIKNAEDAFFMYLLKGDKYKETDLAKYVKYLNKALSIYNVMKNGIEILLNEVQEKRNIVNFEMEKLKIQLKDNIQVLIDDNKLEEANVLIDEYLKMVNNDVQVFSMKAIIHIMKGQIDDAEHVLLNALNYESYNFDLNYNLGYIYYSKKEYELGLQYYKKSYMNIDNDEIRGEIKEIIKEMLLELNLNEDVEAFLDSSVIQSEQCKTQRCLILCHFYSVYTKEFLEKIYNKANIEFDILTMDASYKEKVKTGVINNVYTYNDLNELNRILNSKELYDIINVHFLAPFYGDVAEQIRSKCNKLIITIWGSDFYRTSKEQKEQQRKLVKKSDIITFDNEVTMNEFSKYYSITNKEKLNINRFGLTALEYIKYLENIDCDKIKSDHNIPENSIVVTCGYNANQAHNHLEIIKSIKQIKNKLPRNIYYIFPMTYSIDEKYCNIVKQELSESGLQYAVLEKFMDFEQVAKLTKITDIMVQLQTTDTLSATMQENMYSGNIIITGSWLPYKPLKQIGAYFLEVSSVNKIGQKLINTVQELNIIKQRCKKNKKLIWEFSAWENTVESWIEVYNKKFDASLSEFNHAVYWDYRYGNKFDLESSGTMGLGTIYNKYLYKSRLDILDYLNEHLLGKLINKKVLELGTGTGYFTKYFSGQNIKSYYGIDISQKSVNILSSIYKDFKFKCGDISDKTVYESNKTYDLIFASDVLLHLTNDEKFQKSIHNIAAVLDDGGYFIDIEPITMVGAETSSPHNRIIKYEEFKFALEKENLEILDTIPVTFFMDYPFDYEFVGSIGEKALNNFNEITSYLQDNSHTSNEKEKIAEKIYYFDKRFLKQYGKGLSNKLIIVKKKGVYNNKKNILIGDIWINSEVTYADDFEKFDISELINDLYKKYI